MSVVPQTQIVASSENFFRTNFKSPPVENKYEKEYRSSVVKSSSGEFRFVRIFSALVVGILLINIGG